ncbi:inositol 2-dehydrogenase [Maritalea sp.]|uniref:inositol 2-dehydrogenase n=1 Tax=Maritalea sp. TaxID=2003361 RepID=UPI003EF6076F
MLRIGLLGCGRIGQVHAQSIALNRDAKLVAVADAIEASATKLASEHDAEVRDASAICAADDIDAVLIGTPTDTHVDFILAAAKSGKAILCEKPFDLDTDRIKQCLAQLDPSTVLMFGFQRRFDPHFGALKTQINQGAIGDVEMINLISRDPGAPPLSYIARSGGIFADMMIHDLDMARFLLNEEPVSVQAMGAALVDPAIGEAGDFDSAVVQLQTASGKICQISCSRRATYGYDQRAEVHGSKGALQAKNQHENAVRLANADGYRDAPLMNFFLERYMPAYRAELDHFIEAVRNNSTPSPSGQDALRAQMLAEAALKSAKTNQTVFLEQ